MLLLMIKIRVDFAKIFIKSILLLENVGVQVLGMTSDGASTMWKILVINAKAKQFQN